MENVSKEDYIEDEENSIESKLTHSVSIASNSTKLGNNASFLNNENSELISGNLETSEFVNNPFQEYLHASYKMRILVSLMKCTLNPIL